MKSNTHDKNSQYIRNRREPPQPNKRHPTANIIKQSKTECFPSNTGNKIRMAVLAFSIQHCTNISSQCNKKLKPFRLERKKKKSFYSRVIIFVQNPKESTIKMLEFIHDFCKVSGHMINIQNKLYFYILAKKCKNKILKTIVFLIASKRILRNKPNQKNAVFDTENYKTLLREMKEDLNRDIPFL